MAEINIEDLTTKKIDGTGVFDELMTTSQVRLDEEHRKQRIKGPDYAKVYLGSMEAVLQNSIGFLLGRQEAAAKADLLIAQTAKTDAETLIVPKQGEKIDAEIILMQKQALKIDAEITLINAKILTEASQRDLIVAQISKIGKEELLIDGQILKMDQEILKMQQEVLLMQAQVEQMLFERDLTEAKVWAERAKVSDNPSLSTPPTTLKGLIGGQLTKISNEGTLLLKKGITEDAQTKSGIAATDSIVGRQNALYAKQTDGFDRDAEQKFGKILADSYAVRRSTNDTEPQPPGMADGDIERIMDLMWNKVNN